MAIIKKMFNLLMHIGGKQRKMNEKEFADYFVNTLQRLMPNLHFEAVGNLEVSSTERPEVKHYLDNAYRTYRMDAKQLDEIIRQYAAAAVIIYNEQPPLDKNRIVPMIKSVGYIDMIRTLDEKMPDIVYEQYNEDLLIVYHEDTDEFIKSVDGEELDALGINRDGLRGFAVENLKKLLPEIKFSEDHGIYMVRCGGTYEASLMLFDDLWNNEKFDVEGDIVVGIPTRDLMLVCGSKDEVAMNILKEVAPKMFEEGDHNISSELYRWNGTMFEKYIDR